MNKVKTMINKSFKKFINFITSKMFIRFCISGITGIVVWAISIYILKEYIKLWYLYSSMIAVAMSYLAGFIIQKYWVFENKGNEKIKKQFIVFILTSILFWGANTLFLYLFVNFLHLNDIFAQVMLTTIWLFTSLLVSKKLIFDK